jgi:hypothetical protein
MTPEEATRIVRQTAFPRSGSLDSMVETVEAFAIHVDGLSPEHARARAARYRAAVLDAQAG